jgi:hypothetical protein
MQARIEVYFCLNLNRQDKFRCELVKALAQMAPAIMKEMVWGSQKSAEASHRMTSDFLEMSTVLVSPT